MYNNSRLSLKSGHSDLIYQISLILMKSHTHFIHDFHLFKQNSDLISSLKLMLLIMFEIDWNNHNKLQFFISGSQQRKHNPETQRLSSLFFSVSITTHEEIKKQFNVSSLYNSMMRRLLSLI